MANSELLLEELQRNDSICKNPEQELLTLVRNNEDKKLKKFITENPKTVNLVLGHPFHKPILFACCYDLAKQVQSSTIEILLDMGAHLYCSQYEKDNIVYRADYNKEAIHYASLGENPSILQTIINRISHARINSTSNDRTALNLLIKGGDAESEERETFLENVKILVRAGVDVNQADKQNLTPIFWAARKGYVQVVNFILHHSKQVVDIDNHNVKGVSARDYIKKMGIDLSLLPENNVVRNPIDILTGYLKERKEDAFLEYKDLKNYINKGDRESTMLQVAVEKNLQKVVNALLFDIKVDVNQVGSGNNLPAVEIAAKKGYHKILELMLRHEEIEVPSRILIKTLKEIDNEIIRDTIDYKSCYELLIRLKKLDVNICDENKRTPLHYAAQYGGSERTLQLLRKGASMACTNRFGTMPIEDIDAKILETHLDECIEANINYSIDKENFVTTYNYRTLMPPTKMKQKDYNKNYDIETASNLIAHEIKEFASETQVLSFMSKSTDLKHLLLHPVVTSFLYMKWHRIRWFFLTNLIFYITFCLSLILYILIVYNSKSDEQNFICYFLSILLIITFTGLVLREIFQMIVSPRTYFSSFENWFELTLIGFTAFILFHKNSSEDIKRQVSAVAVLLAAFELGVLIGQHPKMSTNIVMLRTVSLTFFKFLAWYSILIMAFALSFYTLFRENNNEVTAKVGKDCDDKQEVFDNLGISLFKTVVMLTGEFDSSSIKFQTYPITSHLIFMLFVFMIAIILLNLLNGLAVSDTQMIQNNAELVGHIARIEHIAYIESMFLGNLLPKSSIDKLANYCCCSKGCQPSNFTRKFNIPGNLARRVTLFPDYLKDFKMTVYLNQWAKAYFENDEYTDTESSNCINNLKYIYLDSKIAKSTKEILKKRRLTLEKEVKEKEFIENQKDIIEQQKKIIDALQKEHQIILNRLK